MKKQLAVIALLTGVYFGKAQSTFVSDIENVVLTSNHQKVYNDSTGGNGFKSGHAFFPCKWDTSFGGFWSTGWAASAVYDSTTSGSANQYGCAAYKGYGPSNKFAVGTTFGNLTIHSTDSLIGKSAVGFWVCNSTYAYKSMKYGDAFAKKFGDTTGTHCHCPQWSYPDWFKLTVKRYYRDTLRKDSIEVFLADYRFANNAQDYILTSWTWINLIPLGLTDSLVFYLHSTDNSSGFMNTPAYFCLDNLTLSTSLGVEEHLTETSLQVFPNPANEEVEINYETPKSAFTEINILDVTGRELSGQKLRSFPGLNKTRIDISDYPSGVYFVLLRSEGNLVTRKLIKQ